MAKNNPSVVGWLGIASALGAIGAAAYWFMSQEETVEEDELPSESIDPEQTPVAPPTGLRIDKPVKAAALAKDWIRKAHQPFKVVKAKRTPPLSQSEVDRIRRKNSSFQISAGNKPWHITLTREDGSPAGVSMLISDGGQIYLEAK